VRVGRSRRFSPADAEARRPGRLDCDSVEVDTHVKSRVKAGCGAHALPILGNKGASDGYGAVVLNKRVKAGKFGKDAEKMIGNRSAREIVDEPAKLGVDIHPLQEANDVRLGEMVGKERTDDEMNWLFGPPAKDVSRDPANCAPRWGGLGGDGDGVWISIEACEFDDNAACASPALDAAERVAVAAADIDDVERLGGGWRSDGAEPIQDRAVAEEPAIEARKVAEAGAELVAGAGLVDFFGEFGELSAITEIDRVRRHGTSWFQR